MSLHALFEEVNWEPLEARSMKHIFLLLYKMFNNLSPENLHSLIPPTVNNLSRYNLRNAQDIPTMDSRTTQYFNSFCRLLLENLISNFVFIFKRKFKSDIKSIPRYFYACNRRAQVLHTNYVPNVVHLTMTSFRDVSMTHLSVSVVMWRILITTF